MNCYKSCPLSIVVTVGLHVRNGNIRELRISHQTKEIVSLRFVVLHVSPFTIGIL